MDLPKPDSEVPENYWTIDEELSSCTVIKMDLIGYYFFLSVELLSFLSVGCFNKLVILPWQTPMTILFLPIRKHFVAKKRMCLAMP